MTRSSFARSLLPLALAVLVLGPSDLLADPASDPPQFEITDLGSLDAGSGATAATALNASGDVVGHSSVTVPPYNTTEFRAFLYTVDEGLQPIVPLSLRNFAWGINSRGDVVGSRSPEGPSFPTEAFLYTRSTGVVGNLPGLPAGDSAALAINDANQVVGHLGNNPYWGARAFLWSDTGFVDIHTGFPPGTSHSVATGINAAGVVVGWYDSGASMRAFVRDANGVLSDLPRPPGTPTQALSVSASGLIAGTATTGWQSSAVLWAEGQMRVLGALGNGPGSSGMSVNFRGDVVGASSNGTFVCPGGSYCTWASRGFLYRDGMMFDLNDLVPADSGYVIEGAIAINDVGQIVVAATRAGAGSSALLLTPTLSPTKAIEFLITAVEGFDLPGGIETSFTKKLEHALAALEAGDTATACSDLQDFINHANAQSGKKLTVEQAGQIIAEAEAIRAALGCS